MTASSPVSPRRADGPPRLTVRSGPVALRLDPRVLILTLLACGLIAFLALWAVSLGSYSMPFSEALAAVRGIGTDDQVFVVRTLRLPRIVCAILIGAGLAVAGALFQGVVRNPLVSPDIIGIDTGASLMAVFWIVTGQTAALLPVAAFAGALVTAGAIYVLTWKDGVDTDRLILVGIGVGAAIGAGITFLTVKFPVEIVRPAQFWLMGSLTGSNWRDVVVMGVTVLVLIPASAILARLLRTMQLGDDVTRGLGVPLEQLRLSLIVVGCGLAAVAVSVAGPIGFVALMVPHVARMLTGPVSGGVMVFTGTLGAIFLLSADMIAQHALPVSLPVGAITAAVGAPYFLFLLYRSQTRI